MTRGPKRKPAHARRHALATVALTETEHAQLCQQARLARLSVSAFIRKMLRFQDLRNSI